MKSRTSRAVLENVSHIHPVQLLSRFVKETVAAFLSTISGPAYLGRDARPETFRRLNIE